MIPLSIYPYNMYYDIYEDIRLFLRDLITRLGDDQKFGSVRKLGINYVFNNAVKPKIRLRNKDPT